jgi:hypothetical protein
MIKVVDGCHSFWSWWTDAADLISYRLNLSSILILSILRGTIFLWSRMLLRLLCFDFNVLRREESKDLQVFSLMVPDLYRLEYFLKVDEGWRVWHFRCVILREIYIHVAEVHLNRLKIEELMIFVCRSNLFLICDEFYTTYFLIFVPRLNFFLKNGGMKHYILSKLCFDKGSFY